MDSFALDLRNLGKGGGKQNDFACLHWPDLEAAQCTVCAGCVQSVLLLSRCFEEKLSSAFSGFQPALGFCLRMNRMGKEKDQVRRRQFHPQEAMGPTSLHGIHGEHTWSFCFGLLESMWSRLRTH